MSIHKLNHWCVVKKCNNNIIEKRHFFLFPKEHDRWLEWIRACGRHDLEVMGPEYAHRTYRLCHLHFEEKWYKVGKCRASIHPDAVPTIFCEESDIPMTTALKDMENRSKKDKQQQETNSDPIPSTSRAILPIDADWTMDDDIDKPRTSTSTQLATTKETPRKKKLKKRNFKLKTENRILRERIRWLQKKLKDMESTKKTIKESEEHETLRQLGCKLLLTTFAQLLSAQVDAQIKSKYGRRYTSEFKPFLLRLFFLNPQNYRALKKICITFHTWFTIVYANMAN